MQVSTVILMNKSNTSIVQIPNVIKVKLEPIDDNVCYTLNDISHVLDLSDTLPFPFRHTSSTPSKPSMNIPKCFFIVLCTCGLLDKAHHLNTLMYIYFLPQYD